MKAVRKLSIAGKRFVLILVAGVIGLGRLGAWKHTGFSRERRRNRGVKAGIDTF